MEITHALDPIIPHAILKVNLFLWYQSCNDPNSYTSESESLRVKGSFYDFSRNIYIYIFIYIYIYSRTHLEHVWINKCQMTLNILSLLFYKNFDSISPFIGLIPKSVKTCLYKNSTPNPINN
jgi:hypothetical protein